MSKESPHTTQIALNLVSAALGVVLLASPELTWADTTPAFVSAVFLGAFLARLGLSGALRPRTWKAQVRLVVGAAAVAVPCIPNLADASQLAAVSCTIGLITIVLAEVELRLCARSVPSSTTYRAALGKRLFLA